MVVVMLHVGSHGIHHNHQLWCDLKNGGELLMAVSVDPVDHTFTVMVYNHWGRAGAFSLY